MNMIRLERCIVTIASLDQWLATIENLRQCCCCCYSFDIQRCSINMVLGSYDVKMVRLVPSNFSMNQDKEMALFTIVSWELEYRNPLNSQDGLRFKLVLKRKIMNSLLTTY